MALIIFDYMHQSVQLYFLPIYNRCRNNSQINCTIHRCSHPYQTRYEYNYSFEILLIFLIHWISYLHFHLLLYDTLDASYLQGHKGSKTCHTGSTITTAQECKVACDALNKKVVPGQDGNPCYIAGTGKCKQDGRHNPKSFLVCKTLGIPIIYT